MAEDDSSKSIRCPQGSPLPLEPETSKPEQCPDERAQHNNPPAVEAPPTQPAEGPPIPPATPRPIAVQFAAISSCSYATKTPEGEKQVHSVKRKLWDVDSDQVDFEVKRELKRIRRDEALHKSARWNFDFVREKPLSGDWQWKESGSVPRFYRSKVTKSAKSANAPSGSSLPGHPYTSGVTCTVQLATFSSSPSEATPTVSLETTTSVSCPPSIRVPSTGSPTVSPTPSVDECHGQSKSLPSSPSAYAASEAVSSSASDGEASAPVSTMTFYRPRRSRLRPRALRSTRKKDEGVPRTRRGKDRSAWVKHFR